MRTRSIRITYAISFCLLLLNSFSYAQELPQDSLSRWNIDYGNKGVLFTAPDDAFSLHIQLSLIHI